MTGRIELVPGGRPEAWLLRLDGMDQSFVDLADPSRLEFDYVRRLGDAVDAWPTAGPVRIVHVGGAGLSLARYVAATRPGSRQVVLEPDEEVTELVRRDLPLPRRSGIKIRPVDGRTGLAQLRDDGADLIVLDAYADARVPGELVTAEAAAEAARVLSPSGWLLANLTDRAPFPWVRRVVAAVRTALPSLMVSAEPATLRARRPGNLLVVAGRGEVPVAALRSTARAGAAPYRVLDRRQVDDRLGGGRPFRDADQESSPRFG
ncbi:spermidine synthase [Nocardioides ferulae]|uniref:spermidine synthase n=1 Tax=Nocardioides ferulae TaxID=2340821 RepID=UPI000EB07D73|nr:fused MFS/spermidine synthase [Nocardioides ferulae]